jgi:hypothetical protein
MLDKSKASKTVYPDGTTEKKGFFMQLDEELLTKFKVRTTENRMTMTECVTKFIQTYIGK